MHVYATPPSLATLTIADSIAAMPKPSFKAGDVVIVPTKFAVVLAAIPNPTFTRWVYMVQPADRQGYDYFNEEDLIKYAI